MKIINDTLTTIELKELAANLFKDMVKGVIDVDKEILALDAELHADLESLLLEQGSRQENLWGVNLYPDLTGDNFVEFDSMINLRPSQGNMSRGVDDERIRRRIIGVISKRITR